MLRHILAEYSHKMVFVMGRGGGGHYIVKNMGGWVIGLGSGILVRKNILGLKNIDLDNS